nr:fibrous sheath CABYR-binding protein-like [Aegilops tauschii subsp. strangulata]
MVSKLPNAVWPKGAFVEIVQVWQQEWFHITEPRDANWAATPDFRSGPPTRLTSWTAKGLDWGSKPEVQMLHKRISSVLGENIGLTNVIQGWTTKPGRINCPAPLPKNPATPPANRDVVSGETEALSSHEENEEEEAEEVESDSPHKRRNKKRAASEDPEGEAPKTGEVILQDSSDSESELVRKKPPRAKPLAESPPRELPHTPLLEGNSLPPKMAKSETPPRAPSPITMEDTEVSSRRTSPNRGGVSKAVEKAPEVNTLVAEELGEATHMTIDDGEPQQYGPQPNTIPKTNAAPGSDKQAPLKEGGGASAPSAASTNPEAPNAPEEALQCASIVEENRTLMGAVVEKASLLAAAAQAAEVSQLNRKIWVADEEIDRISKRFDETQVGAAEVETLQGALAQAQKEAKANKAATDKAAVELKTEQAAHRQHEARVAEVKQELKDAISKCEALEEKTSAQSSELAKSLQEAKEAWVESRSAREEIRQVKQIAAGKAFLLQSIFGGQRYALLTRVWSSPDAFADLPSSAADAAQFFQAQEGNSTEKLFWS